jgi:hypothetical protein
MSSSEIKLLFGFPEYRIHKINGIDADYPAAKTYDKFTPDEIHTLCKLDTAMYKKYGFQRWEEQSPASRFSYRLKAYWTVRGATDTCNSHVVPPSPPDLEFDAWAKVMGWVYPMNLREAEELYLPKLTPCVRLIIERCPQMTMIHALRGDVSEPYWWAMLSITEHATPNLSKECSDGYPGFTDKELAYRVNRIHKDQIKPALCERLDSVNRGICDLCRFKGVIRSPIALGYENEPKSRKEVVR